MSDLMRSVIDNFYMSDGISKYFIVKHHTVPPLSSSLHYSNAMFEGMSILGVKKGGSIRLGLFHPALNFERLRYDLASLGFRWELYSDEQIIESIFTVCALNGWNKKIELENEDTLIQSEHGDYHRIYVRPLVYARNNAIGLRAKQSLELMNCLVPMGEYISGDPTGINVMLFPTPRTLAFPNYKASSNYQLSIHALHRMTEYNERNDIQCNEVIFENIRGNITEGSGENVVMIRDNELITPPVSEGALPGITYRIAFMVAEEMGLKVSFGTFKYEDIDSAECMFLTGNAAGLVPIKKVVKVDNHFNTVDYMETKEGGNNPLFRKLHSEYSKISLGDTSYGEFFTYLDEWFDESRLDELNLLGIEFKKRLAAEEDRYIGTNTRISSYLEIPPKIMVVRKYFENKKWMLERLGISRFLK
ncbi:MAG: aminotransferase class IV [Candidatus Micrarchaeia archaeon]